MRFIQFLNESTKIEDVKKVEKLIKKECTDILKIYKKKSPPYLYIGRWAEMNNIFKEKPKEGNQQVPEWHQYLDFFDAGFKKVFGKKLRSEAANCSGNLKVAEALGFDKFMLKPGEPKKVFVIFPTDGFKMYWSKKLPGLRDRNYVDNNFKRASINFQKTFILESLVNPTMSSDAAYLWIKKMKAEKLLVDISSKDLYDALSGMQWGPADAIISGETRRAVEKNKNAIADFIKEYYTEGNTEAALKSGNEIMLLCKHYYGIHYHEKELLESILS